MSSARRLAIIGGVAVAAGVVLWLKPRAPTPSSAPTTAQARTSPVRATVLLFADASEANSSCGCGEIIRMVRSLRRQRHVAVREYQPAEDTAVAKKHAVRVSPTVIITRGRGHQPVRFEGESVDVVAALRIALRRVAQTPPPGER